MKRIALSTLSVALLSSVAGVAHAQSSVTLYGIIDESITYASNVGGKSQYTLGNSNLGNLSGSRWGLKGTEDLGGGLSAIFQLENGFDPSTGRIGAGGSNLMFGRQAFVGLSSTAYGTLTLGRQYDPTVDLIQPLTGDNYFGSMGATPGDVDNNDNSARTNSSIKYLSPTISGFQFEGFYALGGTAGEPGSQQTWSVGGTYTIGGFSAAAAYLEAFNSNGPRTTWTSTWSSVFDSSANINSAYSTARSIGIGSVAAQYVTGPFTFGLRYSNVQFKPDGYSAFGSTEKYNIGGALVNYQATADLAVGLGYIYSHGSGDASASYHQVTGIADYNLSKRTDIYLVGAYQHANGSQLSYNSGGGYVFSPANASIASYGYDSSTDNQVLVGLGLRHKF